MIQRISKPTNYHGNRPCLDTSRFARAYGHLGDLVLIRPYLRARHQERIAALTMLSLLLLSVLVTCIIITCISP